MSTCLNYETGKVEYSLFVGGYNLNILFSCSIISTIFIISRVLVTRETELYAAIIISRPSILKMSTPISICESSPLYNIETSSISTHFNIGISPDTPDFVLLRNKLPTPIRLFTNLDLFSN